METSQSEPDDLSPGNRLRGGDSTSGAGVAEAPSLDNRHPLYPWLALCVPFFALAVFVGLLILKSDLGDRLDGLSAEKLEIRQRYAIDHTSPSSVELLNSAFANANSEGWTASERWAVADLIERSKGERERFEGEEFELLRRRFLDAHGADRSLEGASGTQPGSTVPPGEGPGTEGP